MRAFLDSNVLVSGIAFGGNEHALLLLTFTSDHTFVTSDDVQEEAMQVLRATFPRFREEAHEILSLVRAEVVPQDSYAARLQDFPRLRDPNDAHVLAAALASRCDLLITGDKDLLVLGQVEGLRIVKPAHGLGLLRR